MTLGQAHLWHHSSLPRSSSSPETYINILVGLPSFTKNMPWRYILLKQILTRASFKPAHPSPWVGRVEPWGSTFNVHLSSSSSLPLDDGRLSHFRIVPPSQASLHHTDTRYKWTRWQDMRIDTDQIQTPSPESALCSPLQFRECFSHFSERERNGIGTKYIHTMIPMRAHHHFQLGILFLPKESTVEKDVTQSAFECSCWLWLFHIGRRFPERCVREERFMVKGSLFNFTAHSRYVLTRAIPPFLLTWLHSTLFSSVYWLR